MFATTCAHARVYRKSEGYKQEIRVTIRLNISQIAICRTSWWELFNEHFDRDSPRERFLDIDGTERFVSRWPWQMRSICIDEFCSGGRKRGRIDLMIRVKLAATRHFSYRQPYLWDGNVLTVVLIDSGVYGASGRVYRSHEISSQISMYQCVPIRSFYLRHRLPTRAYTVSWTQVARVFYRSSIIL